MWLPPTADYAELIAEAENVPTGSLGVTFMPHLRLANAPMSIRCHAAVFLV